MLLCLLVTGITVNSQNKKVVTTDSATSFKVFGVCEQCEHRIEQSLKIRGVKSAQWDVDSKMLSVMYDAHKISLDKIHSRIAAVGHDTHLKKADDAVYKALPDCCHYREIDSIEALKSLHDSTGILHNDNTTAVVQSSSTEHLIRGVVLEENKKGAFTPLVGASVVWLGSTSGTTTDENGVFNVRHNGDKLIVSYAGYKADTILVSSTSELKFVLASGKQLNEVKVTSSRASSYISTADPFRTQNITQKELFKAACCNLSESFETNPSVDVSYSDAVTGSKQIQLLGLAGIYTQLTVENLPGPRGLATSLGLNSIPGTWIEGIQLSKGTGSVVNGFESIAGQINVELKKPVSSERLYANIYLNDFGKTDVNINLTKKLNDKWSTTFCCTMIISQQKIGYEYRWL